MTLIALFITILIGYVLGIFVGYQCGVAHGERGQTFLGRERERTFRRIDHGAS